MSSNKANNSRKRQEILKIIVNGLKDAARGMGQAQKADTQKAAVQKKPCGSCD
jgi:hypothetical protein